MEKKNIIKLLLVAVFIVALVYLVVDQFNKVGTAEGHIDHYDLTEEINRRIDSLPTKWNTDTYNSIRDVLSDIDVATGMLSIDEADATNAIVRTTSVFELASKSYFTRSAWTEADLSRINHIAGYLHDNIVIEIVDGYYAALNVIANSTLCANQADVENCISKADHYNRVPWVNCTNVKDGLESVKTRALESYTNRALIPLCNRLMNYKSNYHYFDEFDADYQKVKAGRGFLQKYSYSNTSFSNKYSSIDYNNAANDLDPRF